MKQESQSAAGGPSGLVLVAAAAGVAATAGGLIYFLTRPKKDQDEKPPKETDIPIDQKNKNEEGLAVQEKVINEKAGEDTIDVQEAATPLSSSVVEQVAEKANGSLGSLEAKRSSTIVDMENVFDIVDPLKNGNIKSEEVEEEISASVWEKVSAPSKDLVEDVKDLVESKVEDVKNLVEDDKEKASDVLEEKVKDLVDTTKADAVKDLVEDKVDAFKDLVEDKVAVVEEKFEAVKSNVEVTAEERSLVEPTETLVEDIVEPTLDTLKDSLSELKAIREKIAEADKIEAAAGEKEEGVVLNNSDQQKFIESETAKMEEEDLKDGKVGLDNDKADAGSPSKNTDGEKDAKQENEEKKDQRLNAEKDRNSTDVSSGISNEEKENRTFLKVENCDECLANGSDSPAVRPISPSNRLNPDSAASSSKSRPGSPPKSPNMNRLRPNRSFRKPKKSDFWKNMIDQN